MILNAKEDQEIDLQWFKDNRDQLFAQAMHELNGKYDICTIDPALWDYQQILNKDQMEHLNLREWLLASLDNLDDGFILLKDLSQALRWDSIHSTATTRASEMEAMGWEYKRIRVNDSKNPLECWVKGSRQIEIDRDDNHRAILAYAGTTSNLE